jgi:hypothetical protein
MSWLAGMLSGTTFTDRKFSRASRSSREESWGDLESASTQHTVLRHYPVSIDWILLLDRPIVHAIKIYCSPAPDAGVRDICRSESTGLLGRQCGVQIREERDLRVPSLFYWLYDRMACCGIPMSREVSFFL